MTYHVFIGYIPRKCCLYYGKTSYKPLGNVYTIIRHRILLWRGKLGSLCAVIAWVVIALLSLTVIHRSVPCGARAYVKVYVTSATILCCIESAIHTRYIQTVPICVYMYLRVYVGVYAWL